MNEFTANALVMRIRIPVAILILYMIILICYAYYFEHVSKRKKIKRGLNYGTSDAKSAPLAIKPKLTDDGPAVILCFPFHNELDLLHAKLLMLSAHVSLFVLSESVSNDRGHPKRLWFNESKGDARFRVFSSQILHVVDTTVPASTDWELGWGMQSQVRDVIGEVIVSRFEREYPNSIVIFGDSDEVPSVEAVEWLKAHCCASGVTYEFASTMPAYIYGLTWQTKPSGYATATARSIKDEASFWKNRLWVGGGPKEVFDQTLMPLLMYPSGFHCSYCFTSLMCVEKLMATNLADGPPFLGAYKWRDDMFHGMRGCGVTPQGDRAINRTIYIKEIAENYPYLQWMPPCKAFELPVGISLKS
jgi:hypothetical protein